MIVAVLPPFSPPRLPQTPPRIREFPLPLLAFLLPLSRLPSPPSHLPLLPLRLIDDCLPLGLAPHLVFRPRVVNLLLASPVGLHLGKGF